VIVDKSLNGGAPGENGLGDGVTCPAGKIALSAFTLFQAVPDKVLP
jgi:hypothetical protein